MLCFLLARKYVFPTTFPEDYFFSSHPPGLDHFRWNRQTNKQKIPKGEDNHWSPEQIILHPWSQRGFHSLNTGLLVRKFQMNLEGCQQGERGWVAKESNHIGSLKINTGFFLSFKRHYFGACDLTQLALIPVNLQFKV